MRVAPVGETDDDSDDDSTATPPLIARTHTLLDDDSDDDSISDDDTISSHLDTISSLLEDAHPDSPHQPGQPPQTFRFHYHENTQSQHQELLNDILLQALPPTSHQEYERDELKEMCLFRMTRDELQPRASPLDDQPRIMGDTGANWTASGNQDLFHEYRRLRTPVPISHVAADAGTTNDASTCNAIGMGTLIFIDDFGNELKTKALHIFPSSSETVFSPDGCMRNDNQIQEFSHVGNKNGQGHITFTKSDGSISSRLTMKQESGIWYTVNELKMPISIVPRGPISPAPPFKLAPLRATTISTTPELESTTSRQYYRTVNWTANMTKAVHNLELWHQRMAHVAPRTLTETSKVVDGIPNIPLDSSFFGCPFCDKAKLRKQNRRLSTTREEFIPGVSFNMDLGFISGPENLQEVVKDGVTPKKLLKTSRDGYTCYLLIIDAASRYVWTFPLKDGSPPINLIHAFLDRHGRGKKKRISTSPSGILNKSKAFHTTMQLNHFQVEATELDMELDFDSFDAFPKPTSAPTDATQTDATPDSEQHLRLSIRTDNGGELAGSEKFNSTVAEYGYVVEPTPPGSSSKNGKAERPNRTLKERVRCLLYTAGLGTAFWVDALLHAVWLYNRTYHTAIGMTPYERYTSNRPNLKNLLTFGCSVTPKKANKRTSALDPNHFEGTFLGYKATMDNIKYWDINQQRERHAHHMSIDELQYGRNPEHRSPASRHLLETATGVENHEDLSSHILKEPPTDNFNLTDAGEPREAPMTRPIDEIHMDTILNCPLPPRTDQNKTYDEAPTNHSIDAAAAARCLINASDKETPLVQIHKRTIKFYGEDEELINELQNCDISLNIFEPSVTETLPLQSIHETNGIFVKPHPDLIDSIVLESIAPGTYAHARIRGWKSRLKGAIIRMVDDVEITSVEQFKNVFRDKKNKFKGQAKTIDVQFAHPRTRALSGGGIPTLAFDQLNVITHHLRSLDTDGRSWPKHQEWPDVDEQDIQAAADQNIALMKLTRRRLKNDPIEWPKFEKSEFAQLDKYHKQGMFGAPIPRPNDPDTTVLPWVWTYLYKTDPLTLEQVPKARGTCNGGKRYGKVVTMADTYAACVDQPAHRLTWSLVAALNYVALGADVANAFAEADGPKEGFYMSTDEVFRNWWTEHLKQPPIPPGYVIPILKNLQGHPEGPRLWNKHVDNLLRNKLGFTPTTHEPCLYFRRNAQGQLILLLRQVDDFLIAGPTHADCEAVRTELQQHMTNKLNDLGTIKRFNGIDITQTAKYVKLSCKSYIEKIVKHHSWTKEKAHNIPIPMHETPEHLRKLQDNKGPTDPKEKKEIEATHKFSYRQAIGELIFAMTTCRVDIASAVTILSQYSEAPDHVHYEAVKHVFIYLWHTRDEGIYYWRPEIRNDLPMGPDPKPITKNTRLEEIPHVLGPTTLQGACDATWGNDRRHRRSISGIAILFAGAVVYYKCQINPTICLSSTESEFAAMAETGKAVLYLRSILAELGLTQLLPTDILADNHGAICMANSQQPTKRTRHVDIKQFIILQWTEDEKIKYQPIATKNNFSDTLTKPLGRIKFYEQTDILLGRRIPLYHTSKNKASISFFSAFRNFSQYSIRF